MKEMFDKVRKSCEGSEYMVDVVNKLEEEEIKKQQERFEESLSRTDKIFEEMNQDISKEIRRSHTVSQLKRVGTAVAAGAVVGTVSYKVLTIIL